MCYMPLTLFSVSQLFFKMLKTHLSQQAKLLVFFWISTISRSWVLKSTKNSIYLYLFSLSILSNLHYQKQNHNTFPLSPLCYYLHTVYKTTFISFWEISHQEITNLKKACKNDEPKNVEWQLLWNEWKVLSVLCTYINWRCVACVFPKNWADLRIVRRLIMPPLLNLLMMLL